MTLWPPSSGSNIYLCATPMSCPISAWTRHSVLPLVSVKPTQSKPPKTSDFGVIRVCTRRRAPLTILLPGHRTPSPALPLSLLLQLVFNFSSQTVLGHSGSPLSCVEPLALSRSYLQIQAPKPTVVLSRAEGTPNNMTHLP